MPDDLVDIIDPVSLLPSGKTILKSLARKEGLMYSVSHLWIYNFKGEILLQHRCKEKKLYPNKWDISVAGAVDSKEIPKQAAIREAKEEIGLVVTKNELKEVFTYVNKNYISNEMKINEFAHIFFLEYNDSLKSLKLQKEEVDKVKFFSQKEIKNILIKKPKNHLIWSNPSFPKVLELINSIIKSKK
jgi:isopentenyl-diphosphate Delta-isomerase